VKFGTVQRVKIDDAKSICAHWIVKAHLLLPETRRYAARSVSAASRKRSPGGAKDEACAEAGVAKIHDRVEAAAAPMGRSTDVRK
jgi:hypothetical protein